ncbi:MAG: hypothetical protein ACOCV1_01955 [Bacillota bacterium]
MSYKVIEVKKSKAKYTIILKKADKKLDFIVSEDIIVEFRIVKGKAFSKEEFNKLKENINRDKYYQKLLYYVNYKPRTYHEAKLYLDKFGIDEKSKNYYLSKLSEINLLNDELFVKDYIYEYSHYRLIGPNKIIYELKKKGINYSLINKYIIDYKAELIYQNIKKLIEKKVKSLKGKSLNKTIQLIKSYIINKGYNYSDVNQVINEQIKLINENTNEDMALNKMVNKYYAKYNRLNKTESFKNYVIPKLLNKGYKYDKILKILEGEKYDAN